MMGQIISHYRVLAKIGSGGMGEVYRAADERLDREVALKLLPAGTLADESSRKRFRKEAVLLAKLNHPNIETIHDFDSCDGVDFLVMELVPGKSLAEVLAKGTLAEKDILRLGVQLAAGLSAAHVRGIVHRDLKPSNLIVGADGHLKILDFGLARLLHPVEGVDSTASITRVPTVAGTLPYMAPEQLNGDPADERSDIYSVGVVLYEMATGRRPFAETHAPRLIDAILHHNVVLPRHLNARISPKFDEIVMKSLDKDPERRYQSAMDLRVDLERLLAPSEAKQFSTDQDRSDVPILEIAHVLFMDIVGYSKLPMDRQRAVLQQLQRLVRTTRDFSRAQADDELIRLPTGDGMALVFFGDPEAPVRCALELSRALRIQLDIPLRMGVHTGPVYREADINANRNVAGGGINLAQRVMDCGDAGHILISKTVADVLMQVGNWKGSLTDLGEAEVQHGAKVHLFNLHTSEAGNSAVPHKLAQARKAAMRAQPPLSGLKWGSALVVLVLLAGVTAITTGGFYIGRILKYSSHRASSSALVVASSQVNIRPAVAVIGFRNLSGRRDKTWLSEAFTEALNSELSEGGQLRLVSGESVAKMKIDLSLPDSDSYAAGTLGQIRQNTAADYVILGSFVDFGDQTNGQIRVDARLQDARSGETVDSVVENGNEADLNGLLVKTGADLRQDLKLNAPSAEQQTQSRAALPSNLEAARYYAVGLQKLRAFDSLGARDSLEIAVDKEPTFALAHSALAAAWANLGYDAEARDSAKKAVELSAGLAEENQQWIKAQFYQASHDQGKAVAIYEALFSDHQDNLEYGLQLLGAMVREGQFKNAQSIVHTLKALPGPAANDPRIDLLSANAAFASGDYQQSAILAKTAEAKAESVGGRLTAALALMRRGAALNYLGRKKEAIELDEKALRIFAEAGDRDDVAKMNANIGVVLEDEANYAGGIKRQRESLEEFQRIGDKRGEGISLAQLGWAAEAQDRLDEAQTWYEQALAIDRGLDDESLTANVTSKLAEISQYKGDLSGATLRNEQVLAIAKESGDLALESTTLNNLVDLYITRGDLATAKELNAQADAIYAKTDNKRGTAIALDHWGSILAAEDNLAGARQKSEESVKTLTQNGEKQLLPWNQMSLATIEIEQGHMSEAEALLTQVINDFRSQRNSADEGGAMGIYARAELESGDIASAQQKAEEAKALSADDQGVRLIAARVEGLTGNRRAAEAELNKLLKVAERQGNVQLAFDVRLALGEIALKSHDPGGRKILSDLAKEAASKGFLLVSQKARLELSNSSDGTSR